MIAYLFRRPFVVLPFGAFLFPWPAHAQAPAPTSGDVPEATTDIPSSPELPVQGEDGPVLEKLTFEVAIQRALARNPTALQAAAEIRRYRALMEQVRSASLPTLSGTATYTRLDNLRMAQGFVENGLNVSATVSVPLVNVRGWVQWQQANDQVNVARLTAADVRRVLAVTTGRAYLAVIREGRLLETAKIARDNAKAHYEFTRAQLLGGIGNRLDEARAAQELTADEVLLQNQEVALFRAREALGVLVAGEGAMDAAEWTFGPMPALGEALTEAEGDRTDVRAREAAAKAADRTVRQAYADYLPYLNLVASPYYQNPPLPTIPETGWEAELVLTLPLYDGGLRYGQEHERAALADEARLQVEATVRQAKSDVRAAFEEMQRADVALGQAHQSAFFAAKALGLAEVAYRGGATTNLEVIDAARQARDAETQAAIAEDAAREARLDLLAATGRFPSSP